MSRFGVMKHLRVLEDAGLVVTRRQGREKLHYLNPVPIRQIHDRWIGKYPERQVSALATSRPSWRRQHDDMTEARLTQVYQLFIKATRSRSGTRSPTPSSRAATSTAPGRLGLRAGRATPQLVPADRQRSGATTPCSSGPAASPTRTPGRPLYDDEMAAEERSRVTWEIEPAGRRHAKLTLMHDQLEGAPKTAAGVAGVDVRPQQHEDAARNGRATLQG